MTAIVLPDIDRSTLEELRDRMPSLKLSEIELPSIEQAGREADRLIDRLLGRSKPSIWPWVAGGIGLIAIVGAAAALMLWLRRPAWPTGDPATQPAEPADTGYTAVPETGTDRTIAETYGTAATFDDAGLGAEGGRP